MCFREGKFFVAAAAGEQPGSGITEAFADVFAPAAGAPAGIGSLPPGFARFGGPAELSFNAIFEFGGEELLKLSPPGISQPPPNEVEELMREDSFQLGGVTEQGWVQVDFAAMEAGGRVEVLARAASGVLFCRPRSLGHQH